MGSHEGGTALVIGGASGIGAALVERYKSHQIPVTVWDVDGHYDIRCDIADPVQIEEALQQTIRRCGLPGPVTITAGIGHSGLLADMSTDEWDRVMQINTRGPWLCLRAVANVLMGAGQSGSLVGTSSVSAHLIDRSMGAYCASKAALSMLVKVAAAEWGPQGIRVNAVAPGVTMTPMLGRATAESPWLTAVAGRTALGRLGEAADIARTIRALHDMDWVTGQIIDCDGGLSLHSPINAYGHALEQRRGPTP
ncbi:MAG TPA: SDR family oxidoreductase [Acidimicrobiales bacterium]|jgi:NAD(P)-dependent dehydrogenase (short-subunit alcohol dehydrogenase family)|nr:SDR family oxidoreductase [Acidimicrobiales bacterium]